MDDELIQNRPKVRASIAAPTPSQLIRKEPAWAGENHDEKPNPALASIRCWRVHIIPRDGTLMDRYLIESPHDAGDCKILVQNVYALGYLNNCDWGCMGGVHKAWVIIEAQDEKQALLVVPFPLRKNATAIKIVKFEPEMVKQWKH